MRLRIEIGTMAVIFAQIIGMLINEYLFQDVPTSDGFSQNFKCVVQTTHRIGVEAYNHSYTDKPLFPAWVQKFVWTFQSMAASTSDVYNLDIRFKYGDLLLSRDEFQGVYLNLAKLSVAALTHALLTYGRNITFNDIIGAVWYCFQMQQRVGFGQVVDSGVGMANLFIPGSIVIVGDTIIAMNERNAQSFVGQFALMLNDIFNDDVDDSEGDQIDQAFFWGKFAVQGLVQFVFVAIFAKLLHFYNKQISDLDLSAFLKMPWYNLIFALWNITLGIGISPAPVTLRDKVFFFCQLFIMTKIGVMFTGAYDDLIQFYIPQNKQNVFGMIVFSLLYQMFLLDQTATMGILAAPTFDSIMNQIADAIYHGYDLASTTGNGDIMPGGDIKWILMIPQFQIWEQILGQQYSFSNLIQDQLTSKAIQNKFGLKEEQFQINDETQQETGIFGDKYEKNEKEQDHQENNSEHKIINGKGSGNKKFMDKIRKLFKENNQKDDIIKDISTKINELPSNKLKKYEKKLNKIDKITNGKGSGDQNFMNKIRKLFKVNDPKESNRKVNDNDKVSESVEQIEKGKVGGKKVFINQLNDDYGLNNKDTEKYKNIKYNKIAKDNDKESESVEQIEKGRIGGHDDLIIKIRDEYGLNNKEKEKLITKKSFRRQ